jgi:hypothetical protein
LKDELFSWGIRQATNAALMARAEGWTIEAVRELRNAAPDVPPVMLYKCLCGEPTRLFGPDEMQRRYLERIANERRERQLQIDKVRQTVEAEGQDLPPDERWRIDARLFREFESLGESDEIKAHHRAAQERYLIEGPLPEATPVEPITRLITSATANIRPNVRHVPPPESIEQERAETCRMVAAIASDGTGDQ